MDYAVEQENTTSSILTRVPSRCLPRLLALHSLLVLGHIITNFLFVYGLYGQWDVAVASGGMGFGLVFVTILSNGGLAMYHAAGGDANVHNYWFFVGNWKQNKIVRIIIATSVICFPIWSVIFTTSFFGPLYSLLLSLFFAFVYLPTLVCFGVRGPARTYTAWGINSVLSSLIFGVGGPAILGHFLLQGAEPWMWLHLTLTIVIGCLCIVAQILVLCELQRSRQNAAAVRDSPEFLQEVGAPAAPGTRHWLLGRLRKEPGYALDVSIWGAVAIGVLAMACWYLHAQALIPHSKDVRHLVSCSSVVSGVSQTRCSGVDGKVPTEVHHYGTAEDGTKLMLTAYRSTWDSAALPAVVLAHGGGFLHGDRKGYADDAEYPDYPLIEDQAIWFAKRGFVAFSIDYRCDATQAAAEAYAVRHAVHDAKAAVRWIVKNAETFSVDSSRIAGFGDSAGGITLATMNYVYGEGNSGNPGFPSNLTAVVAISGGIWPLVVDSKKVKALQSHELIPFFAVSDDSDMGVMPAILRLSYNMLQRKGLRRDREWALQYVSTHWWGPHVPWDPETREIYRPYIMSFLTKALHLDGSEAP